MDKDPAPEEGRASESLGRAIQVIRAIRGLSRRELAERADLSYSYLSEIETGKKQPSSNAIQDLARALEVRPSELVAEAERWERERIASEDSESVLSEAQLELLGKRVMRRGRTRPPSLDPLGARARQQRWLEQPLGASSLPLVVSETRGYERREYELEALLDELRELLKNASDEDREIVLDLARRLSQG